MLIHPETAVSERLGRLLRQQEVGLAGEDVSFEDAYHLFCRFNPDIVAMGAPCSARTSAR